MVHWTNVLVWNAHLVCQNYNDVVNSFDPCVVKLYRNMCFAIQLTNLFQLLFQACQNVRQGLWRFLGDLLCLTSLGCHIQFYLSLPHSKCLWFGFLSTMVDTLVLFGSWDGCVPWFWLTHIWLCLWLCFKWKNIWLLNIPWVCMSIV